VGVWGVWVLGVCVGGVWGCVDVGVCVFVYGVCYH